MARLPIPWQDDAVWGEVLNDFLSVSHRDNGRLKKHSILSALGETNFSPYITPEEFGAVWDGVTDDTKAFQDAIDHAADIGVLILCSAKTYAIRELYFHYREWSNFPENDGRPTANLGIIWMGMMSARNWLNDIFLGTTLKYTWDKNCLNVGDGDFYPGRTSNFVLKDLNIVWSTPGRLVSLRRPTNYPRIIDVFLGNEWVWGIGLYIVWAWQGIFKNINIQMNKENYVNDYAYTSGAEGLRYGVISRPWSMNLFENIICRGAERWAYIGGVYDPTSKASSKAVFFQNCQFHNCATWLEVGYAVYGVRFQSCFFEHNITQDIVVKDSAHGVTVSWCSLSSNADVGNIIIWSDTGSEGRKRCSKIIIEDTVFTFVRTPGSVMVHDAANDVTIQRCTFKSNGGIAVNVSEKQRAQVKLVENDYFPHFAKAAMPIKRRVSNGTKDLSHLVKTSDFGRTANFEKGINFKNWDQIPDEMYFDTSSKRLTVTLPEIWKFKYFWSTRIFNQWDHNLVIKWDTAVIYDQFGRMQEEIIVQANSFTDIHQKDLRKRVWFASNAFKKAATPVVDNTPEPVVDNTPEPVQDSVGDGTEPVPSESPAPESN